MRNVKAEGIVIKRRNYGESDRLLTVFTQYHGKMQIKASGVRKITSRRSAHVELLNYARLTVHTASKIPILIEAESILDFSDIKEDLEKVGFAYHLCELVDKLCPENQEQKAVFDLLYTTLMQVASEKEVDAIIHSFEVTLLSLLGYWHGNPEMAEKLDTQQFIENIIERKLKSKDMFAKLQ